MAALTISLGDISEDCLLRSPPWTCNLVSRGCWVICRQDWTEMMVMWTDHKLGFGSVEPKKDTKFRLADYAPPGSHFWHRSLRILPTGNIVRRSVLSQALLF